MSPESRGRASCLFLVMTAAALIALSTLPQGYYPSRGRPVVSVSSSYSSVSSEVVDRRISAPIERRIARLSGVEYSHSVSRSDSSTVYAVFSPGTDRMHAASRVRELLPELRKMLPSGVHGPHVREGGEENFPIWIASFPAEERAAARRFAEEAETLNPRIRVEAPENRLGGRRFELRVNAGAASAAGSDLIETISKVSARTKRERYSEKNLSLYYRGREAAALEEAELLGSFELRESTDRLLSETTRLTFVHESRRKTERIDGRPSLFVAVFNESGEQTIRICRRLERLCARYPEGRQILNRGDTLSAVVRELLLSVAVGVLLIGLLLSRRPESNRPGSSRRGSSRPGRIGIPLPLFVSIPVALFSSALVLHLTGANLDMMSISGITASIGLCVDSSVLAFETTRCYGLSYFKRRTSAPILLSTLSTLAVFAPLPFFPPELTSRYSGLALVAVPALISSTAYTLLLLPSLVDEAPDRTEENGVSPHVTDAAGEPGVLHRSVRRIYRLIAVFRHLPKLGFASGLLLLLAALAVGVQMEFLPYPNLPSQSITLRYEFPAGTVTDTVLESILPVESQLLASAPGGELRLSAGRGRGVFTLFHPSRTVRTACRRLAEERFERLPYGGKLFVEGSGEDFSGISLHLFGSSFPEAAERAGEAAMRIEKMFPSSDISLHFKQPSRSYKITIPQDVRGGDRTSSAETAANLMWAFSSAPFEKLLAGGREYDMLLEPESIYDAAAGTRGLLTSLAGGSGTPAGTLRSGIFIERGSAYASVSRRSTVPSAGLTVVHPAEKRGDIATLLDREFPEALVAPELRDERRLKRSNILLLISAFLMVALLLYAYFGCVLTTLACLLQIPLSYVLPVLSLAVFDLPLSIPTLAGFLLLTGVSVNNGIVLFGGGGSTHFSGDFDPLLDFARKEHPLMISALTTAAGVLPTALTGFGSAGVLAPLSIVVASGTAGSFLFLYLQCGLLLARNDRRRL